MADAAMHVNLEPIYVVGSHEEFTTALAEKLAELVDRHSDARVEVTNVSHALAFDADGQAHWSALVTGRVMVER